MTMNTHDTAECAYCNHEITLRDGGGPAAVGDDQAWRELASEHAPDCEWIATRPHRREPGAIHCGYVITPEGAVYLQLPEDNHWGFLLADDDQSWPGGFGLASEWEAIADDDHRITSEDRNRLQAVLDDHRANS